MDVTIRVVDTAGHPVAGAHISIHSDVQEGVTDQDGYVTFHHVEPGAHQLVISYNGQTVEKTVDLSSQPGGTAQETNPLCQYEVRQFGSVVVL